MSVKVIKLTRVCTIRPSGDLSVWPSGGDGAGGRADGGKWQHDLRGLQTPVWPDQWEHWRCLPATSRRRQQGEAHLHTHTIHRWFPFFFSLSFLFICFHVDVLCSWAEWRPSVDPVSRFIYLSDEQAALVNQHVVIYREQLGGDVRDEAAWGGEQLL